MNRERAFGLFRAFAGFFLGAIFITAGLSKIVDPKAFAQEIANFQLLPALAPYLAAALPATEIVAGGALLVGTPPWRRAGAAAIFALTALFTVAVSSAAARGLDISCGCFGAGGGPVTWLTVARNVGLLAIAGALVATGAEPRRGAPTPVPAAPAG
jgi:putative oxidoreductase